MTSCKRFVRIAAIFLTIPVTSAVAAPALQMHRAVYDLSLGRTEPVSNIIGLDGRMVVEWRGGPSCGGYTSLQRVVTHMTVTGEVPVGNDIRLSYWEAADGNEFRFTRTEYANGELTGREEGTATRKKGGKVQVLRDGETLFEMEQNVLFPVEYNLALIKEAEAGHRIFSRPIFDGTEESENPTTAFIGKPVSVQEDLAGMKVEGNGAALADVRAWPVRIGYFDAEGGEDSEGMATFEMGHLLFPNGVAASLTLDYTDLELKGKLSELTYFAPGDC
ncbi:MAG: cell envelope integrity EipB family protein [Parvibaculum sp.]|nr:cell envelope integrity EipB family protein [Parvibaculum sp.]